MNLAELTCEVAGLARRAGQAIMGIYAEDFAVHHKIDASPLTAADLAAHQIIVSHLARMDWVLPILSEESTYISWEERSRWQRYWLIDPLDGTREFIKRNGEFTVNIALIDNHRPILGVVLAPAIGELYCAWEGAGAFFFTPTEATAQMLRTRPRATPLIVVGSRSHQDEHSEGVLSQVGPYEVVPLGSSLKFCRIARGKADLYLRFGKTSEWDTAAGQCILEQAGGAVTDLSGIPLRYNYRESVISPHFMAYGDCSTTWKTVEKQRGR